MCFHAPRAAFARQDQPNPQVAQKSRAAATAPSSYWLHFPCRFTDEEHIWVDLLARPNGGLGAFNGFISVGSRDSERRFPIEGRFIGKTAKAQFTDEDGVKFPCTLTLDGLRMQFETGRTLYELEKCAGGVGIGIDQAANGLRITLVRPDYPAGKAGLREGDIITAVDGRLANPVDPGIRGEIGTPVKLAILRVDGSTREFTLTRAPLELARSGGGRSMGPSARDSTDRDDRSSRDSQNDRDER